MTRVFYSILVLLLALGGLLPDQTPPAVADSARVIPHPRLENYGQGVIRVAHRGSDVAISCANAEAFESETVKTALELLSERLDQLGSARLASVAETETTQILIAWSADRDLRARLRECGANCEVSGRRLEQAYTLKCTTAADGAAHIVIRACSDLGVYYATVSLCQLLDCGDDGQTITVPVVKIADWPEIGLRLAKTSASLNPLPRLERFADWLPLYKINVMGLQLHGNESKKPGVFTENVRAVCSSAEEKGVVETIVYFCPFRGEGYDFNAPADREQYAALLQWILRQGADGIEIDYNDWPNRGTPIEDVINLACRAVAETSPQAYVLYCPPNRGASQYRGPASLEMRRILSNVPANVRPLWTGMSTLIEMPLKAEQVRRWTRDAGRRPFLWVNRVAPHVSRAFAQTVDAAPDALVFRGDLLPRELDSLFDGVHLNAGFSSGYNELPGTFDAESLAYMATAADYVWNPRDWEPAESARRARRFVQIMQTLVGE